jgi:hypothetical protein
VIGPDVFSLAALLCPGVVMAGAGLRRKVVALAGQVAIWLAAVCRLASRRGSS